MTGSRDTTTRIGVRAKGYILGELNQNPEGVPAALHQTTWCAEKTIAFIREDRDCPWLASVNIYDPHPPFNRHRRTANGLIRRTCQHRSSETATWNNKPDYKRLISNRKFARPDELDIRSPILPQTPRQETGTVGAKDAKTLKAAYYAMIQLIDEQLGRILETLDETGQTREHRYHFHKRSWGDARRPWD